MCGILKSQTEIGYWWLAGGGGEREMGNCSMGMKLVTQDD